MPRNFFTVARIKDVPVNTCMPVEVEGRRMLICNLGSTIHAVENTCTHDGGELGTDCLEGMSLVCPRHGARFNVTDGKALSLPAVVGLRSYPVFVDAGDIKVRVD